MRRGRRDGEAEVRELEELGIRGILRRRHRHHAEIDIRVDLPDRFERPEAVDHHGGFTVGHHGACAVIVGVKGGAGVAVHVHHARQLKRGAPALGTGEACFALILFGVPGNVLAVNGGGRRHERDRLDRPGVLEAHGKRRDAVFFQRLDHRFQLAERCGNGQIVFGENVFVVENALAAAIHRHGPGVAVCVGEGGRAARLIGDAVQERLAGQLHDVAALRNVHGVVGALENIGHLSRRDAGFQNGRRVVCDDLLLHGDIGILGMERVNDLREGLLRLLFLVEKMQRDVLLCRGLRRSLRRGRRGRLCGGLCSGGAGIAARCKYGQHHNDAKQNSKDSFHLPCLQSFICCGTRSALSGGHSRLRRFLRTGQADYSTPIFPRATKRFSLFLKSISFFLIRSSCPALFWYNERG